jgi:anaerobic selenocysteine-containing dehydrogenase
MAHGYYTLTDSCRDNSTCICIPGKTRRRILRPTIAAPVIGQSVQRLDLPLSPGAKSGHNGAMSKDPVWHKTACNLCYANCGLEVQIADRDIIKVRGDSRHPRSKGYLCQKAGRVAYYANERQRLDRPLRRRPDGGFDAISWELAIAEIGEKFLAIRDAHGADALGHYGGGGQGNHSGGAYGIAMMRALGARQFYSSLAQEKSGRFWVNGHMFGAQNCNHMPLIEECDLLLLLGSNMWQSQCEPGARDHLRHAAKSRKRKIIVIDPVLTRDAELADLHLQLRPGTDTYLLAAMLALLEQTGAFDAQFITAHTTGAAQVRAALRAVPVDDYIARADVPRERVDQAVAMIAAARAMALRSELGIEMGRNSTLNSYLGNLLFVMTGHFGRPGTHTIHTWLQPLFGNSKGARSAVTGMEEIAGLYPPNRFPDEILADHPGRLRAVLVDSSNPANSAADSGRVEQALSALDLLVVVDVALTETAALAHYVLPASAQYEKWEFTLFTFSSPINYFHLRAPLFEPLGGTRIEAEIYAGLCRAMNLLPEPGTLAHLRQLAGSDRAEFAVAFANLVAGDRTTAALAPVILFETLGKSLQNGAASAAFLWPACHRLAKRRPHDVCAALGSDADGAALGEKLFARILASSSGTPITITPAQAAFELLGHKDGVIRLANNDMLAWLARLGAGESADDPARPYILSLGQRRAYNANQIIRDPRWRKNDNHGALRIAPSDLDHLGTADGGWIVVETETGSLTAKAEADAGLRPGHAVLPHGYGMAYTFADGKRVSVGPRINTLTAGRHCDPIAATPYHKNVPANLRRATNKEVASSEADAQRLEAFLSGN